MFKENTFLDNEEVRRERTHEEQGREATSFPRARICPAQLQLSFHSLVGTWALTPAGSLARAHLPQGLGLQRATSWAKGDLEVYWLVSAPAPGSWEENCLSTGGLGAAVVGGP